MQKSHLFPTLFAVFGTAIASLLPASARAEGEGKVADELAQKITQALAPRVAPTNSDADPEHGFSSVSPFVDIQNERRADDSIVGIWELVKTDRTREPDDKREGRMFCAPNGSIDALSVGAPQRILRWSITPIPQVYAAHCQWSNDPFHLMHINKEGQLVLIELGMQNWQIEGVVGLLQAGYSVEELVENYKKTGNNCVASVYKKKLPASGKIVVPPPAVSSKAKPAAKVAKDVPPSFANRRRIEPNDPFVGVWQGDKLGGKITVYPSGAAVFSVNSQETGRPRGDREGDLSKAPGTSVYRLWVGSQYSRERDLLIYMDEKDGTWKWMDWHFSDDVASGIVFFLKQGVPIEKAISSEVHTLTKVDMAAAK